MTAPTVLPRRVAAARFPYLHTQRHTACPRRRDGHDRAGVPGDCTRAAVATLLREPDDLAVPHFVMTAEGRWWPTLRLWLRERHGLDAAVAWRRPEPRGRGPAGVVDDPTDVDLDDVYEHDGWADYWAERAGGVLLSGPSPRGPFGHLLVGTLDGRVLWDPHPSPAGLLAATEALVLVDARLTLHHAVPARLALPAGGPRP